MALLVIMILVSPIYYLTWQICDITGLDFIAHLCAEYIVFMISGIVGVLLEI